MILLFLSQYRALLCSNICFGYFFNGQVSELNVELSYFWQEVQAYRNGLWYVWKVERLWVKQITLLRRKQFFFCRRHAPQIMN